MIVEKFGGVTVDTPEKIKSAAQNIFNELKKAQKMIVVVSAMGSTTNNLIQLAKQISKKPNLRELDMLLTTGERISSSLMTMALLDLGVKATSLTGSQAGIVTDENHTNAFIKDIRPQRIVDLFKLFDVIVIAGFQGVSEQLKNVTTLGRGGSDTTAIALASKLNAQACHILKELPAIYSADPKLVPHAKVIHELTFKQVASMTFWGAKVLHHRSAKLAEQFNVPIYVGPAHNKDQIGTWIKKEIPNMFENPTFFSVTAHSQVKKLFKPNCLSITAALNDLQKQFKAHQITDPQILSASLDNQSLKAFITGPQDSLDLIDSDFLVAAGWSQTDTQLSSVTTHCYPTVSPELQKLFFEMLSGFESAIFEILVHESHITLIVSKDKRDLIIQHLHRELLEKRL